MIDILEYRFWEFFLFEFQFLVTLTDSDEDEDSSATCVISLMRITPANGVRIGKGMAFGYFVCEIIDFFSNCQN